MVNKQNDSIKDDDRDTNPNKPCLETLHSHDYLHEAFLPLYKLLDKIPVFRQIKANIKQRRGCFSRAVMALVDWFSEEPSS